MIDGLYHFLGKMYWNYCSCNPIINLMGCMFPQKNKIKPYCFRKGRKQ